MLCSFLMKRAPRKEIVNNKKIEKVFNEYFQGKLSGDKNARIQKLMEKHGYSKSSAAVCQITKTKKWQELLANIDDEPFLDELKNIALGKGKDSDKIKAITELLKLKKRYPEQQKAAAKNLFQTQINNLMADDDDKNVIDDTNNNEE